MTPRTARFIVVTSYYGRSNTNIIQIKTGFELSKLKILPSFFYNSIFMGNAGLYSEQNCKSTQRFFCLYLCIKQARSQDLKKGGAFLKEWENCKQPWPEFSLFLNQIHTVYPISAALFLKLRRKFRPKSEIQTVFQPKNRWSQKKKKKDLHRNWDGFSGQHRKLKRFFRPNQDIYFTTSAPNFIWGGCFHFFTKNRPQKHQKRAILHTLPANGGGSSPPPAPPGYATGIKLVR